MTLTPYERTLRRVSDPLSSESRKVRKTLLVWSLAAAAITIGGLFPTEITALGLKISPSNKVTIYWLVAIIIGYHMLAFLAYSSADVAHWYTNLSSTDWEEEQDQYQQWKSEALARPRLTPEDRDFMEEHERRLGALWRSEASDVQKRIEQVAPVISIGRALIDFVLPIIIGLVALGLLARAVFWMP